MPATNTYLETGVIAQTTDATQTAASTFATTNDSSYFVDCKVIATETVDHDETGSYWRQATFKNDGGTLTLVGSVRTVVTDNENTGGWDVTLDASGTSIRVLVTGAASTTVNWRVDLVIHKVE